MSDLPEAEYKNWVHPKDAFRRATDSFGSDRHAAIAIYGSLRDGLILAVAEKQVVSRSHYSYVFVKLEHWRARSSLLASDPFWTTAYISILIRSQRLGAADTEFGCHGVRFNPAQITRLIGDSPVPDSMNGDLGGPDMRPSASEANVRRWATAFNAAYPNATEDFAVRSAKGFFQGHRISREAVRKVLPPRRPGRPTASRPVG